MIRPFRRLLLPALLLTTALPGWSQIPAGATVQPLPKADDPAELLAGALRTLAVEPNNLDALVTAGTNALALGDPNAAVGFFGRAQGVAPRDGRVKAGLGSALVQMEKPADALRMFDEAVRLGVPELQIARDRGLAYDLRGDPTRAQRDYQIVLAQDPSDDGVRRRLALSQGISGNREAAIATLDPLIRKRDIAGWRAQTFVLAMTGDARGASSITHIMLPTQADALQPFLERLPQLSAADKARAVHFGEMPSQGRSYTPTEMANVGTAATYAAPPAAKATPQPALPAPAPAQTAQASDLAMPVPAAAGHYDLPHVAAERNHGQARAPLRTVGTPVVQGDAAKLAAAQPQSRPPIPPTQTPPAASPVPSAPQPAPASAPAALPAQTATQAPPTVRPLPEPIGTVDLPASRPAPQPAPQPTPASQPQYLPPLPPHQVAQSPVVTAAPAPRPAPKPAKMVGTPVVHGDEAKIAEATEKARTKAEANAKTAADETATSRSVKSKAATRTAAADDADETGSARSGKGGAKKGTKLAAASDSDAKTAKGRKSKASDDEDSGTAKGKSSKTAKSAKAEKPAPSRVYVQVAGGANRDDMDKAWAGVKKKAPDLMKGHSAATVPVRATNRLVVGPFKDQAEAQAFVNKAAGKGVSAFVVTSEKGQKVEKLGGGE